MKSAKKYTDLGSAQLKAGKFTLAVKNFTKAIELDSEYIGAYLGRGDAFRELGEYTLAIADYDQVIRLSFDQDGRKREDVDTHHSSYAFFGKSDCEKNLEIASYIADCTETICQNPRNADAHLKRALAYRRQNAANCYRPRCPEEKEVDPREVKDLIEAFRLIPQDPKVLLDLGKAYMKQDEQYRSDLAGTCFTEAIRLDPENCEAYQLRGDCQGDRDDYTKLIELQPRNVNAYISRGNSYFASFWEDGDDRYFAAIADYLTAIRLSGEAPEFYCERGLEYSNRSEYGLAIAYFIEYIRLNPEYSLIGYQQLVQVGDIIGEAQAGDLYSKFEGYGWASHYYEEIVKLNPEDPKAYIGLGDAHTGIGVLWMHSWEEAWDDTYAEYFLDLAIGDYTRAIELEPDNSRAYFSRANVHRLLDELSLAVADEKKAIELGWTIGVEESSGRLAEIGR